MTSAQLWMRLRVIVKSIHAVVSSEPKQLASMLPMADRALEILSHTPTADPLDELEYLIARINEIIVPWRPSGRVLGYIMPPFAKSIDREVGEARKFLSELRRVGITADPALPTAPGKTVSGASAAGPPSMFIGSSTEGLPVAEQIQLGLEHSVECTIWSQGVFGLSTGSLESLVTASRHYDFATLVLTPDDLVHKRGKTGSSPRDNVIFELGLFMGALGRERTFIVYCRNESLDLPSDLAGITPATYAKRSDGNLQAALGPVCTLLKHAIQKTLSSP